MESTEEYFAVLKEEVAAEASLGVLMPEAFFNYSTGQLIDEGEINDANYSPFHAVGLSVDGYDLPAINDENILTIIMLDWVNEDEIVSLTQSDLNAMLTRANNFIKKSLTSKFLEEIEETSDGFRLAQAINARWSTFEKVKYLIITNKKLSSRVKVDSLKIGEFDEVKITCSVWDIQRLCDLENQGQKREPIVVNFEELGLSSIPALKVNNIGAKSEAYLAVMSGEALAKIYDKYSTRLLEQNVRVFLQATGKVNKGMRQSIAETPSAFFSFNNGITATAEAVVTESSDEGVCELAEIRNFQIVNGGQTTASIYYMSEYVKKANLPKEYAPNVSNIFVQMKLILVDPEASIETVQRISKYSNTQNSVKAADFFSNHPFHQRIEEFSRKLSTPSVGHALHSSRWFYERVRGQYRNEMSNMTKSEKEKFLLKFPKNQMFTKTDLAKYEMAFRGKPEWSSRGAEKCFVEFAGVVSGEWDKNKDCFNEEYYKSAISRTIIFKSLEKMVQKTGKDEGWYEGGGTRAPIVVHTIGKVVNNLNSMGLTLPYQEIWNKQVVDDTIMSVFHDIAQMVAQVITNQGSVLPTEYAKSQACTTTLEQLDLEYPKDFIEKMVSRDEAKAMAHESVKDHRETEGLKYEIWVAEQEPKFWKKVLKWGDAYDSVSPKERSIIEMAIDGHLLTSAQARVVQEYFERISSNGYK